MPNWKKLIVSGSDASLSNLNVANAVTASFFKGDGSALTGNFYSQAISNVTSVNIDHNLDEEYPIVQVYDNSKAQMLPATVTATTSNRVVLTFDSPFTGQVSVKK